MMLMLGIALLASAIVLVTIGAGSATTAPVEMNVACALKSNGLMRYVTNLNQCKSTEIQVTIKPGPVTVCIQPDGTVRKIPPFQCKKPGVVLTLPPASGTVYFCAANLNGQLRYVTSPSQCTSNEFPVFVGPNDTAPAVTTTVPTNGATNVAVNTNITVNFNEFVTFSASSFSLECPSGTPKSFGVSGSGTNQAVLDPTADLPQGTTCAVKVIANNVSDVDSNDPPDHPAADYNFSFTTDSAPTVTSTSPANGATAVNASSNITVTFSELVNAGGSSFTIECPSGSGQTFGVSGSGSSTITLDPNSDLPAATTCTVTVLASGITDVDSGDPPDNMAANYVFSFTTADAAPSVTTTSPADGATHVAVNTNIVVNFSEPVTASGSSFTLECPSGSAQSFSVSGSPGSSITLDPTGNLPEATVCTVTVLASGISDVDAVDPPDNMAANYVFSFTTDGAPAVVGSSPSDGATDVAANANILVFFNEPVVVDASSFTIVCDGNPQTFGVSGSGTDTITLDPNSDLPTANCTVTAVAANISDVDGGDPPDHPAANHSFSFATQDAAPSVTSTSPADGALDVARNTNINITFSEPVTATNSSFTLECPAPGNSQAFSVSGSPGSSITLDPNSDLPAGAVCTVTVIANQISDVDSVDPPDNMAANFVFSFTTAANSAPTDIQLSNSSIAENQPSGTDVGTLTTTDPDAGDTHTYSLESTGCGGGPFPDNSSFQIGGVGNDKLQSSTSFNYEVKNSYTVCVRSTDSGSLSFDKQFVISITNVNEPPTDISLSNNSIDENQPSGSLVGNLSQVGDPDSGETYTFTLLTSGCSGSFPDSSSFQISGSQLQSAVSFNYEVKNSYTICVRVNDPGSPNLSFEKQFTIAINNVNDAPADGNESANAVGNTLLEYGSVPSPSSAPKKVLAGNLLANATDEDQPPQTLTISASDTTSANGGSVSVSAAGAFSYVPPAGFTGTDTFNYTVSDGNGGTDNSTVTITVASRVWYVKNNASAGGLGRSTDPFDTLAEADTAANATGDITYVYKGDGTTTGLTGGFSLLANQKLLGEPVNLVVGADTLATGTPANRPSLAGTVALASGSRVEAVDIAGSGGAAIAGTNTGGSDVTNVNLSGGAGGVALTGAAAGTFNFTNFTINTTGGTGFLVNSSGGPTINVGSGSTENVSATGGPAVDVRNVNGASSLAFDAVSSTNSSGAGINLDSNGATPFSASSGSISGAAGNAVDINGGSGNVTYPGTLGNGAGNTADITGRTGGSISLSGNINDTNDAGGGITMSGNTGGSTTFSGGTKTLNTGASAAFSSTGSAHTITFSGGGMNIDTTSGAGFSATGGGTVNVTGSVNTIDTTTGTALNVASTNIGASGLNFQSISSNGAANGIVLNGTGSSGGLTVTGDGTNTSLGGNASGGTITNASGADGTTAGIGVYLNNTSSLSLSRMTINGTNQNFGMYGSTVGGVTLQYSTVGGTDGTSTGLDEGGIIFDGLTGTSTFTKVAVSGSVEDNFRIRNSSGTSDVTIDGSTFTNAPNDNLIIEPSGTSTVTAHVTNNTFAGAGGDHFQTATRDSATLNVVFTGNVYSGGFAGSLLQGITISGGNLGSSEKVNFNISNNGTVANPLVGSVQGGAINVNEGQGGGTWQGQVSNNIIGNAAVADSGSAQSSGIRVENHSTSGTLTAIINGNTVRQWGLGPAINAQAGDAGNASNTGVLNVTVTTNTATNPGASAQHGFVANIGAGSGTNTAANVACIDPRSNTLDGNVANGGAGVRVRHREISTVRIPGYTGSQYDTTAVANYLQSLNPASVGLATATSSGAGPGFTNTSPAGSACPQPTVPS
jgi:methionine-rich copper-binding protein CopC